MLASFGRPLESFTSKRAISIWQGTSLRRFVTALLSVLIVVGCQHRYHRSWLHHYLPILLCIWGALHWGEPYSALIRTPVSRLFGVFNCLDFNGGNWRGRKCHVSFVTLFSFSSLPPLPFIWHFSVHDDVADEAVDVDVDLRFEDRYLMKADLHCCILRISLISVIVWTDSAIWYITFLVLFWQFSLARFDFLIKRRPLLINSVLLRQNPHNTIEWQRRVKLMGDDKVKVCSFTRLCKTKTFVQKESSLIVDFCAS